MNDREGVRLAALEYLGAVRPEVDSVLQKLVDDVRVAFGTGLALVNLILPDVQYFQVGEEKRDEADHYATFGR